MIGSQFFGLKVQFLSTSKFPRPLTVLKLLFFLLFTIAKFYVIRFQLVQESNILSSYTLVQYYATIMRFTKTYLVNWCADDNLTYRPKILSLSYVAMAT